MSKGLFIVGTGTDVGKTYVTGLLLKLLWEGNKSAAYYKAAVSGNERDETGELIPGDAVRVKRLSGIVQPVETMCPYLYEQAVSPHLAARLETDRESVDMEVVRRGFYRLAKEYEYVTMEGSGGILCPLRIDADHPERDLWLEDVIKGLDLPCLLVADAGLGTINSVILTVRYMQSIGLRVKGIIMNHYHAGNVMEEDNRYMCERMTGIPVIGTVSDEGDRVELERTKIETLYEEIKNA